MTYLSGSLSIRVNYRDADNPEGVSMYRVGIGDDVRDILDNEGAEIISVLVQPRTHEMDEDIEILKPEYAGQYIMDLFNSNPLRTNNN